MVRLVPRLLLEVYLVLSAVAVAVAVAVATVKCASVGFRSDESDDAARGQVSFSPVELDRSTTRTRTSSGLNQGVGWYDPRVNGGRLLDFTTRHFGEPLNVIISAHSDPFVLTETGFHYYAKSIGFSEECLGMHYGNIHRADLGDGDGRKEERFLARQYYFPVWGTCWESVAGGNHFRAWRQNGTLANSGAWFLAVSKEEDSSKNHMIVDDGYNLGRDWLVQKATSGSHYKSMWWRADVVWNENDLLQPGRRGVNHAIAQDGRVAILTVKRV